jgi:hypothetical protein
MVAASFWPEARQTYLHLSSRQLYAEVVNSSSFKGEMSPLSARLRRHFPWSDFLTNREDLDMSSEITSSNTMQQDSIAPSH